VTSEVDAIIACNAAGKTGCFAGYTTNGKHAPGSYHGKDGTDSPTGSVGLAVDFDAFGTNAAKLKACAQWFMDRYGSKLAELIHSPMGLGIKDGKVVDILKFYGRETYNAHFNHVHVAVKKGVFLMSPAAPTNPTPIPTIEGDGMSDALVVQYPSGSKTVVTPDGAVFNAGTPFFGSMYDLKPEEKNGVTSIRAVTPENPNDPGAGYCLWSQSGGAYHFTPTWWKSRSH
jgi:hypothetical protein